MKHYFQPYRRTISDCPIIIVYFLGKTSRKLYALKANGYIASCNAIPTIQARISPIRKPINNAFSYPLPALLKSIKLVIIAVIVIPAITAAKLSLNPILVVAAHISPVTNTKFASDIDISLLVDFTHLADSLNSLFVTFPRGAAIYTFYGT